MFTGLIGMSLIKKVLLFLIRPAKKNCIFAFKASIVVVSVVAILNHYSFLENLKISVMKLAVL